MDDKGKIYTICDIAEYAGVSRSTVSRVVNNVHTRVTFLERTQAKIREAIRHFDYTPNASARRLSVKRSFVLGLQLPKHGKGTYSFSDYNLIGAMQGFETALQNSEYRLQLLFGGCGEGDEDVRLLKSKSIDGLLVWGHATTRSFPSPCGIIPSSC